MARTISGDISAAFPLEAIERCIVNGRIELGPAPYVQYFAFVDPSGGRHDAFTLSVAHHHTQSDLVIINAIRAARPPFDPSAVTAEYAAF